MIIILLILLFTNGHFNTAGYYFMWNSLIGCMLFPTVTGNWIWFGSREEYMKYLERENERLNKK